MIRVDYDNEPLAQLVLTRRRIGWTAELRPLPGQPPTLTVRPRRLRRLAAARALLNRLDRLNPNDLWLSRNLYAGLTAALDAAILHGTGTSSGPTGIRA